MSGVIRDLGKLNQRQLETLKKRNEREISSLNNAHQNYKAELKKSHDAEVVDIQDENHRKLNTEAQKKEKILEEMKSNLHKTSQLTDKQLKELKKNAEETRVQEQRKLSEDRQRIISENELYLEELNDRFNSQSGKIAHEGKQRVEEKKTSLQDELTNTQEFHQNKIQQQTEEFTTRFNHDDKNYRRLKDNQDNQFKKERLNTNQRQQIQLKNMSETHTHHIEKRDDHYRKGLKEQDIFFEKKYADQLNRHGKELDGLKNKNEKILENLKADLTKEISKVTSKDEDPFYQFDTLKPRLVEFQDRVEINVDVPDHAKQDISLTFNGKEAVVSFNRRYVDASKTHDGTINKINKIETFVTRLQTGHFLDPKSVKSSYEDGTMNFVIKKS